MDDDFPLADAEPELVVAGLRLPAALDLLPATTASDSESESLTLPMTCLLLRIRALDERVNFLAANNHVHSLFKYILKLV